MRKFLLLFFTLLVSSLIYSQKVNGKDLKNETDYFELWMFKKPFTSQECYFVDYGQEKFKPHYYDHKRQAITDNSGQKFEKGKYVKLAKFLKESGWKKTGQREAEIGDIKGTIISFEKAD